MIDCQVHYKVPVNFTNAVDRPSFLILVIVFWIALSNIATELCTLLLPERADTYCSKILQLYFYAGTFHGRDDGSRRTAGNSILGRMRR